MYVGYVCVLWLFFCLSAVLCTQNSQFTALHWQVAKAIWQKGHIAAAHKRFNRIRQSPGCANVHSHLILAFLGQPESKTQTASRSQPFLQGLRSWQTDRPTDHTAPSITIGGSYVRSTAMRPNNNMHLSALLCLRLSTWVRSVRHYDRRRSTTSSWQKHCVINPTSGYLRTETRRWFAETDSFRPTRTHGVE